MAINKAMRLALKALSYPDVRETYKTKRLIENLEPSSIIGKIYKLWDRKVLSNGREVTVRIYYPKRDLKRCLILFFHGGGWVTESVDTYNSVCQSLARHMNCRVVSAEYSLAPENPFPVGLEDCYAVAKDIMLYPSLFDVGSEEIVLVGDSAGANLAAAVSLMARDRGEFAIHKQALIYPAVYNDHSTCSPFQSIRDNGTDYLLTSKHICEYIQLYIKDEKDLTNPYFAPLLASDLSRQPDTLIITAEFDPLRDEGEAYGEALQKAGNNVSVYRINDALHGFFSLDYHFKQVKLAYHILDAFINSPQRGKM